MNYIARLFSNPDLLEEEFGRQLNQITLHFRNKHLETQFISENRHRRILLFRISTILYVIINLGYVVNSSIIYTSKENVIYRSLYIFWLIVTLFLQRFIKTQEHIFTNTLIYISSVFNVILFVNFTKNIFSPKQSVDAVAEFALVSGLTQAIFAISFVLTQSHYIIQTITFFTYFFIIMGTYEAFDNYKLWTHYLLMIFCGYVMRYYEKLLRIQFLKIQKSYQNLEACKRIYDETVPTSIIILEQGTEFEKLNTQQSKTEKLQFTEENKFLHVVYFNQSAALHFQSIEENSILSDLNQIEVIETDTNIQDRLINERLLDQIPKSKADYQTQQRFSPMNKLDYDILNSQLVVTCQRKIGVNKYLYYDVKPVSCLWEGKICVMLILNETTDRVLRIKQLQDLDKYKDNLLATVSHDLKTPLNGLLIIVNVIQLMLQNKTTLNSYEIEEIKKNLEDMVANQQLLFTMINDLIDYSQLKVQNLRLNFTQFRLNNCIEKIKKMLRRQIELKKLEFRTIGLEEEIVMYSDEVRLTQILFNLINNAIKFTFQGSITLKIKLSTEKSFKIVQFQVIDTGIGIPTHIQFTLFKAYSTYNLGNCNNQGVGLGLVISKKMVGLLGPKEYIEMESREGKGSNFGFQIYQNACYKNAKEVDIPDDESMREIPSIQIKANQNRQFSLPELPKLTQKIKILIVDDTPFNIYSLKLLIQSLLSDAHIEEAQNGQQAINKVQQNKYDIIFMDLIMPGIDGIETTKQIRRIEKSQLNLRTQIIMLSAMKSQEDVQKSQFAGADDFLEKPLKLSELKEALHNYNYI